MPEVRDRLTRLVRRADADLAETALVCATLCTPPPDVAVELLRVDALADQVRTTATGPVVAQDLTSVLAGRLGLRVTDEPAPRPEHLLLPQVLAERVGAPVVVSALYVAVARRAGLRAWPVGLPGQLLVGVAGDAHPLVLDPAVGGREVGEQELVERVASATDHRLEFRRAMLRPLPAVQVARRLLHTLAGSLTVADRLAEAIVVVQAKLALPNHTPWDLEQLGTLQLRSGRFDAAATAFEAFLDRTEGDTEERRAARRSAIDARARMN